MPYLPSALGKRARILALLMATTAISAISAPPAAAEGPQDPWYMDTYRLDELWQHTRGEGITVAVIDTGVDASRPALEGRVLEGVNLTRESGDAHTDTRGHGTDMAGLIAGDGAQGGVLGIAPEATILPIRVSGSLEFDFGLEERMAEAIEYAVDSGAHIINISIGGKELGVNREEYEATITEAARQDVLIFAATGNEGAGANTSFGPANRDGVVGVAAVDRNGDRASYSTYGPQVNLAGPGEDVPGRCADNPGIACLREEGGTSAASALVSGSAALIRAAHPDWTNNQVLRALVETAQGPGNGTRNDDIGYGLIRPDRILLDPTYDPGPAGPNPLFEDYEAALDPPASPEPTAPEPDPEPSIPEEAEPSTDATPVAAEDDSNSTPLALAAIAGAVVVGGGITTAVVFTRRRRTPQW
jgi:type VII secretion-associated serine protease mycosin